MVKISVNDFLGGATERFFFLLFFFWQNWPKNFFSITRSYRENVKKKKIMVKLTDIFFFSRAP